MKKILGSQSPRDDDSLDQKLIRDRDLREQTFLKRAKRQKAITEREAAKWSAKRTATLNRENREQALKSNVEKFNTSNPIVRKVIIRVVFVVAIISLISNVLTYYRWSPSRPLLHIGNRTVTKAEYDFQLEAQAGKQVLEKIVFKELIKQAAIKENVVPTSGDIDTRLAELRRRNPGHLPNQDTPMLRDEVGTELSLENLRLIGLTTSDSEIQDYYNQHSRDFALPPEARTTLVVTGNASDAKTAIGMLSEGISDDAIAAHPGMHVAGKNGFTVNLSSLPPAMSQHIGSAVYKMRDGDIQTFPVGNMFLTFKTRQHDVGVMPTLDQVRTQVIRLVELNKAPTEAKELSTLYSNNSPKFDMRNYARFFADFEKSASTDTTAAGKSSP